RYLVVRGQTGDDTLDATATSFGVTLFGDENNDTIKGGAGGDVLVGGIGIDTIFGNGGNDVSLGDQASIERNSNYVLRLIQTVSDSSGAHDVISGGLGDDILLGGTADDTIDGDVGDDILVGDGGSVIFSAGVVVRIVAANHTGDGNDTMDSTG